MQNGLKTSLSSLFVDICLDFCYHLNMKFVDCHAHLIDERFEEDVECVVQRAKDAGVTKIITASTDILTSKKSVEFASCHEGVFAAIGIHPENVEQEDLQSAIENLKTLAQNKKVVAIGEIGLEYHFFDGLSEEKVEFLKDLQKKFFIAQINLANELSLPVVVHSRDAMGDTLEILKKHPLKRPSLLHCYSGSIESAQELSKLGFSFSFGGVVSFKNAGRVKEVVARIPIERILLETDCPYLAPEPFRGTRNEPKNIPYIADAISRIKELEIEKVARITTENAENLFGI